MEKLIKVIKNSGLIALILGALFWLTFFMITKGKNLSEYKYLLTLAEYSRDSGILLLIAFGLMVLYEPEGEQYTHSRRR